MSDKTLPIKVPKGFREILIERFSYNNALTNGDEKEICIECPLCKAFRITLQELCKGCPFKDFPGDEIGCLNLINNYLPEGWWSYLKIAYGPIWWSLNDNEIVKDYLGIIIKGLDNPEIIEWV